MTPPENTAAAPPLVFKWEPVGKQMKTILYVFDGEDGEYLIDTDTVDLAKTAKRTEFARRLAERTGAALEDVEGELLRITNERSTTHEGKPEPEPADDLADQTRAALEKTDQDVREEAERLLEDPALIDRIQEDIEAAGVAGEDDLRLTLYLVGTSRLLPRPLAAIVQGQSSSGKSYTVERVASLFPPEAVVLATQMTPQALFHARPGSLSHRWVVAGERSRLENDDKAEATRALREMLSAGRLTKMMPVKEAGEIVTVTIEQAGPIAFVESTTSARVFEEDANRCIMLSTDERRSQTRTIMRRLALHASGKVQSAGPRIVARHHALQRLLERRTIVIPFAERLVDLLEVFADRVECRRAYPMLLALVHASALLHQRQRQTDQDGGLIAEPADYGVAARLLSGPLARTIGESLSDPTRRFLDRLLAEVDDPIDPLGVPFTAKDVRRRLSNVGRSTVAGFLSELEDKGFLDPAEVAAAGRGRPPKAWKPTGKDDQDADVLPPVEQLFPEGTGNEMDKFPPAKPG
jgi:DNA primase